ncbi:MAG: hypothetical protein IT379_22435 [Deltaproteobacteria bacterium]|nr:hypothetical protein [Deltaproteobacteria bacterium]
MRRPRLWAQLAPWQRSAALWVIFTLALVAAFAMLSEPRRRAPRVERDGQCHVRPVRQPASQTSAIPWAWVGVTLLVPFALLWGRSRTRRPREILIAERHLARDEWDCAIEQARQALLLPNGRLGAMFVLAQAAYGKGDLEGAADHCAQALRVAVRFSADVRTPEGRLRATIRTWQAMVLAAIGRTTDARAAVETIPPGADALLVGYVHFVRAFVAHVEARHAAVLEELTRAGAGIEALSHDERWLARVIAAAARSALGEPVIAVAPIDDRTRERVARLAPDAVDRWRAAT